MIIRIQSPEKLMPLFTLDHDEDSDLPCKFTEWVQWVVGVCAEERVGIFADVNEKGKIESYIVAADNVSPPLTASIMIIYAWTKTRILDQGDIFKALSEWGISRGATTCTARTNIDEKLCNHYGFKTIARFIEKELVKEN